MDISTWAAFVAASAAVLAVPGPVVLMVVASVAGWRSVWPLALGKVAGDMTVMAASGLGAGLALAASPRLFAVLQLLGAAWLMWLGLRLIREAGREAGRAPPRPGRDARLAARAWAAVVLNPLSLAFSLAFVPQFVDPARPYGPQALILGGTHAALALAVALAYAGAAARLGRASPGAMVGLRRGGGAALVCMGVALAAGPV